MNFPNPARLNSTVTCIHDPVWPLHSAHPNHGDQGVSSELSPGKHWICGSVRFAQTSSARCLVVDPKGSTTTWIAARETHFWPKRSPGLLQPRLHLRRRVRDRSDAFNGQQLSQLSFSAFRNKPDNSKESPELWFLREQRAVLCSHRVKPDWGVRGASGNRGI